MDQLQKGCLTCDAKQNWMDTFRGNEKNGEDTTHVSWLKGEGHCSDLRRIQSLDVLST